MHLGIIHLVPLCIKFIESKGLLIEGIFRIPGSNANIQQWIQILDSGEVNSIDESVPVHDVCGLLKRYLVDLPERLIPLCYTKHFKLEDSNDDYLQKINVFLEQLPVVNKIIVAQILELLYRVSQNKEFNKMSINNIATCWSLIIFKEPDLNNIGVSKELMDIVAALNKILVVMLSKYDIIKQNLVDIDKETE